MPVVVRYHAAHSTWLLGCREKSFSPDQRSQSQSRQSTRLFLQSSELGPPTPSSAGECAPPPHRFRGGGYTLGCGRRVPIRTGDRRCDTLARYRCTLWVQCILFSVVFAPSPTPLYHGSVWLPYTCHLSTHN